MLVKQGEPPSYLILNGQNPLRSEDPHGCTCMYTIQNQSKFAMKHIVYVSLDDASNNIKWTVSEKGICWEYGSFHPCIKVPKTSVFQSWSRIIMDDMTGQQKLLFRKYDNSAISSWLYLVSRTRSGNKCEKRSLFLRERTRIQFLSY